MLIDIDRIIVGDRIRKDFGDIQELADDIRENGLINPPVVNKEYLLLAGERRLRACKLLGWPQIEVRMMDTRDAEHDLDVEISENECRKEFTKTERLDYARRLARIKSAKSEQGKRSDLAQDIVRSERNRVANAVAQTLGTNRETLRQEQFIADNADLLDPADFADWDEGKLSTNKAFQRIKAAQKQAEQERDEAEHDAAELRGKLSDLRDEVAALEKQNDELYDLTQQQQVVEREVVREVVPDDYADIKRHVRELENGNRLYSDENASLRKQLEDAQSKLDGSDALNDAKSELAAFVWKYRQLDELSAVIAAAEQLLGIA